MTRIENALHFPNGRKPNLNATGFLRIEGISYTFCIYDKVHSRYYRIKAEQSGKTAADLFHDSELGGYGFAVRLSKSVAACFPFAVNNWIYKYGNSG